MITYLTALFATQSHWSEDGRKENLQLDNDESGTPSTTPYGTRLVLVYLMHAGNTVQ